MVIYGLCGNLRLLHTSQPDGLKVLSPGPEFTFWLWSQVSEICETHDRGEGGLYQKELANARFDPKIPSCIFIFFFCSEFRVVRKVPENTTKTIPLLDGPT